MIYVVLGGVFLLGAVVLWLGIQILREWERG